MSLREKVKISANDTGSVQVQVVALSERIKQIAAHINMFPKDNSAKRGLTLLLGKRKRFMNYLKKNNPSEITKISEVLASI